MHCLTEPPHLAPVHKEEEKNRNTGGTQGKKVELTRDPSPQMARNAIGAISLKKAITK